MERTRLMAARMRQHWTLAQAADHLKIDQNTLYRWEHGKSTPRAYNVQQLCEVYQATAAELDVEGVPLVLPSSLSVQGGNGEHSTSGSFISLLTSAVVQQGGARERETLVQAQSLLPQTIEHLTVLLSLLEECSRIMALFDASKRETLEHLAATLGLAAISLPILVDPEPWERLARAHLQPATLNPTTLDHFEHLIGECWKLSNTSELTVAEHVLGSFLPKILVLPQQNERTAYLASQGLRLQSIFVHHRLQLTGKVILCQQAVEYGRLANDATTLVGVLLELSTAYFYTQQMEKYHQTVQEALYYGARATPIVQSVAYLHSARSFAYQGRKDEAAFYLKRALDVFPDNAKPEDTLREADFTIYRFNSAAGKVFLALGQLSEAHRAFEGHYVSTPSGVLIPERQRLDSVNLRAKAAIQENDQEQFSAFLKDVLAGALALGSKKRFDEASATFREEMPASWMSSGDIQAMAEQYHLTPA